MRITTFLRFFIVLLILVSTLTACNTESKQLNAQLDNFSKTIQSGDWDNLSLKVYYIDYEILTRAPLTPDILKQSESTHLIIIDGNTLREHTDLLKQINSENIVLTTSKSYMNARICYAFEYDGSEILEIILGAGTFVNGIEVKPNPLFRQIAETFLDSTTLKELDPYFRNMEIH